MIPPLSGPVDFHPDLVSIILISDLKPGHVCCDKFSQCKPNVGRSKPPHPLNQCCFNAECWIWLLSALRCRGHHTYPAKPAFVGNVDYEGCRGDLLCFKAGAAFSLGQVLKDGGMPVSRLAFGPQVVIYAWTDCSPQSQEWCEPVPSTFAGWKKGPCTAMFATTMPVGPPCIHIIIAFKLIAWFCKN